MPRTRDYSITKKLTRMNMFVSAAALLLACGAFMAYDRVTVRQSIVHDLSIQAQIAGSNSISALLFNDPQTAEKTLSALQAAPNIVSAGMYTLDGRLFAAYVRDRGGRILTPPSIPSGQLEVHRFNGDGVFLVRSIVFQGKPVGVVYIQSDLRDMNARLERLAGIAAVVLGISLMTALLFSGIFRRSIAGPIVNLADVARTVSREKNYSVRAIAPGSSGELGVLIEAFNEMLGQIQERDGALRQARDELEQRVEDRTAQLAATEERFRNLAEAANDAIISADSQGRIVYFNRAAERIFSYSADEAMGQPLTILMPERFRDSHRQGFDHYLKTSEARVIGKTVEVAGRRKDGSEFPLQLSLAAWRSRDGVFFTGIMSDITERKRAEESLRRSEERIRLMVLNVKDYAILMLDTEGRIISWNEGAERIKGYRSEEIIGRHFSCFYQTEDVRNGKPARVLAEATKNGRWEDEGWRVRKDGSIFWANVVITAIRDPEGDLRGFAKMTRDMTQRKQAEDEIRRLNKGLEEQAAQLLAANQELEAFSYSVSHDLRAPLRSIDGFSQILLEDYAPSIDEKGREHLHRVRAATQRMGAMIDDFLNLARVARAEVRMEKVDLSALAGNVAADLQKTQPERRVEFQIQEGIELEADARLLRLAVENLLGNAWKFTAKRESARIEFGRARENGAWVYFVRDNGAGFDPSHAGKLFGVFERLHSATEFPGTGVGLATVQRIVQRHGGRAWAEGAVGQGATFYFTFDENPMGKEKGHGKQDYSACRG